MNFSTAKLQNVRMCVFAQCPAIAIALSGFLLFLTGCQGEKTASAPPPPDVQVTSVVQQSVPIYDEWVGSLDGYDNAQIQPQVTGYIIAQTYREGSPVRKGQVLFEIDPRPFQAVLDQAKAQLAQSQAQPGKTKLDAWIATHLLAKERAIAAEPTSTPIFKRISRRWRR